MDGERGVGILTAGWRTVHVQRPGGLVGHDGSIGTSRKNPHQVHLKRPISATIRRAPPSEWWRTSSFRILCWAEEVEELEGG